MTESCSQKFGQRFVDKVALITGGTSGIGMAIAGRLLTEGARVVITGRDEVKGRRSLEELQVLGEVRFVRADTSLAPDVEKQTRETLDLFNSIDIVVPCAGVNHIGTLTEASESAWDTIMSTNLKGVFLTIQAAVPYLKKTKGTIVTIASDVALRGSVALPVYSIAKSAVWMLTRMWAYELASSGVRVNAVLPANILPGMQHNLRQVAEGEVWTPEDTSGSDWVIPPAGRFGNASEVAAAVLFLASNDASYCNGSGLLIDGALNAAQP
jgi:NAD(P)-dependent dehydrogenase (short-subunit alcohol dehydrogenase family)